LDLYNEDAARALYDQLTITPTNELRAKLIETLEPDVRRIAEQKALRNRNLKPCPYAEDFYSEGTDALCDGVKHVPDKVESFDHCIKYLMDWVHRAMEHALVFRGGQTADMLDSSETISIEAAGELQAPGSTAELLEEIEACCEGDDDKAIVALGQKGYSLDEIARELELPYDTVRKMRTELIRRVEARLGLRPRKQGATRRRRSA